MKHFRSITIKKPAAAANELNITLEVISVISAVIGVLSQVTTLFGVNLGKNATT